MPPLIISTQDVDQAIVILDAAIRQIK